MKKWIERHLITTWVICSILFAVVIHILFYNSASGFLPWLEAKWSAGDILTYVSTVALGLLAVWQNRRFKEENDVSQLRLENLTQEANELAMKNRIIGIESENLIRLKKAMDDFSTACDPIELSVNFIDKANSITPKISTLSGLTLAEKHLDDSFFALSRELRINPDIIKANSNNPLLEKLGEYYYAAKEFINEVSKGSSAEDLKIKQSLLTRIKPDFLKERETYLIKRESMLNQAIYGNLQLSQIKEMYFRAL